MARYFCVFFVVRTSFVGLKLTVFFTFILRIIFIMMRAFFGVAFIVILSVEVLMKFVFVLMEILDVLRISVSFFSSSVSMIIFSSIFVVA